MFKRTATRIAAAMIAVTAAVSGLSATASAYTITPSRNTYQPVYQPVRQTVTYTYRPTAIYPTAVASNNTRVANNIRMNVPSVLGSYRCTGVTGVTASISQAVYSAGGKTINVRKASGSCGLSNNYPGTLRTNVNGCSVIYKGTTSGYFTATWSRNGYNYMIQSNVPLNKTQMDNTVKTMLNA